MALRSSSKTPSSNSASTMRTSSCSRTSSCTRSRRSRGFTSGKGCAVEAGGIYGQSRHAGAAQGPAQRPLRAARRGVPHAQVLRPAVPRSRVRREAAPRAAQATEAWPGAELIARQQGGQRRLIRIARRKRGVRGGALCGRCLLRRARLHRQEQRRADRRHSASAGQLDFPTHRGRLRGRGASITQGGRAARLHHRSRERRRGKAIAEEANCREQLHDADGDAGRRHRRVLAPLYPLHQVE
eukprot:4166672-Prymnesium_polylepis.3